MPPDHVGTALKINGPLSDSYCAFFNGLCDSPLDPTSLDSSRYVPSLRPHHTLLSAAQFFSLGGRATLKAHDICPCLTVATQCHTSCRVRVPDPSSSPSPGKTRTASRHSRWSQYMGFVNSTTNAGRRARYSNSNEFRYAWKRAKAHGAWIKI